MRRENLVFHGIIQHAQEDCVQKIKGVLSKMGLTEVDDIKFDRCHRLAGAKPQAIIVRFNYFQDRVRVWDARKNLKGSNISLSEDFPGVTSQKRRSLFPIMMKARKMDKFAYLKDDKLIIDRKTYSVETLHTLPPELDPVKSATAVYGDVTAFYGGYSPLSNFHECDIHLDGNKYFSVEQYFQLQKCIFADDTEAASKVKKANSSLACKKIGDAVNVNMDEWLPVALQAMEKAMLAKFSQNERAKAYLRSTGNNILAEATLSKIWGTGLKLNDEANGAKNWQGKNETGLVLM